MKEILYRKGREGQKGKWAEKNGDGGTRLTDAAVEGTASPFA